MMDDTADAREAQEEDAYFYIYIYKKARSTNCPSGFCSHHSSGLYFPSFELWGLVCLVVGGAHTDAAARNSHSSAPKGWRRLTKKFGLGSSRKKNNNRPKFLRTCMCVCPIPPSRVVCWRHDNYMNHHNHHQLSRAYITDPKLLFFSPPFFPHGPLICNLPFFHLHF